MTFPHGALAPGHVSILGYQVVSLPLDPFLSSGRALSHSRLTDTHPDILDNTRLPNKSDRCCVALVARMAIEYVRVKVE